MALSALCLLSGQLLEPPVTRGRRAVMCPTAAAAPPVGTGAPAVAFPLPRLPTPRPAPSIWGMPLVLPRRIMDLRQTRMLSCWMNQLHAKERYVVGCGADISLGPAGAGRRPPRPSVFSGSTPSPFPFVPVFPHDVRRGPLLLCHARSLSPLPQSLPSLWCSYRACGRGPPAGSSPQHQALLLT